MSTKLFCVTVFFPALVGGINSRRVYISHSSNLVCCFCRVCVNLYGICHCLCVLKFWDHDSLINYVSIIHDSTQMSTIRRSWKTSCSSWGLTAKSLIYIEFLNRKNWAKMFFRINRLHSQSYPQLIHSGIFATPKLSTAELCTGCCG